MKRFFTLTVGYTRIKVKCIGTTIIMHDEAEHSGGKQGI